MIDLTDIDKRFTYHAPSATTQMLHTGVREALRQVAVNFNEHLPPGRELELAITHLEEAMFWANASLARGNAE